MNGLLTLVSFVDEQIGVAVWCELVFFEEVAIWIWQLSGS